ncbi:glycosyltransferase [Gloeobacter morelensis]|uniref:Glycosyltransferase n=1 Tax=Gloeobacter morelensis MG652769 TaxID=2781736 RepID=A0ABY3PHH0_9CYAN|nr:glycosyltransferase [Gloeobacter morelensis]UFP93068.1 glycosyltransferase [Gloeobacter morelensis MG652769]
MHRLPGENFSVHFRHDIVQLLGDPQTSKVAVLVTSEYEGIYKNGGIGTYYRSLSEMLAAEGWYVILVLCFTQEHFAGTSDLAVVKHVFSANALDQVLHLQPMHREVLHDLRYNETDQQGFGCLLLLQALIAHFQGAVVYVEFPEMLGFGFYTVQAKRAGLLGPKCIVAITLHSGCEWLYEAQDKYLEENIDWFWSVCHREQTSFEQADLAFFPSQSLKMKLESYSWHTGHAVHMPNFVPVVHSPVRQASCESEIPGGKVPLVFFGRLEDRKGLFVFVQAIKLLPTVLRDILHILFVGKVVQLQSSQFSHLDSRQYIEQQLSGVASFEIYTDLYSREAIQFVDSLPEPLVCLASPQENFPNSSLEMGQLPIRLVISDTGGFRETLQLIGRSASVYWFKPKNPQSLCRTLVQALTDAPQTIESADAARLKQINRELLERKIGCIDRALRAAEPSIDDGQPIVTIAVVPQQSGVYLLDCLASIEAQTYSNRQVVVLCTTQAAQPLLQLLEQAGSLYPNCKFAHLDCDDAILEVCKSLLKAERNGYFLALDADDILKPFAIENLILAAKRVDAAVVATPVPQGSHTTSASFAGGSLPGILNMPASGPGRCLASVQFLKRLGQTRGTDIRACSRELIAAAAATGEVSLYFPFALCERKQPPVPPPQWYLSGQAQFQLEQLLAQVPASAWPKRQIHLLVSAVRQLLQLSASLRLQLQQAKEQAQLQSEQFQSKVQQASVLAQPAPLPPPPDNTLHLAKIEQLEIEIAAMRSSKFWKLRSRWFKLKKHLGLATGE